MSERTMFQDSVIPLPSEPGLTPEGLAVNAKTAEYPDEVLEIHFALSVAPDVQAQLEEKVAKGEEISLEEIDKLHNASPAGKEALVAWLKKNGYEITHITRDGIYAKAKASQIASSLAVNMVPVTKDGVAYTSAQNAPSLPEEVAGAVRSIDGLQPYRQFNKHLLKTLPGDGNRIALEAVEGVKAASVVPNIANAPPYLIGEICHAYMASGLGLTGAGQTIAVLIDTFPVDTDLTAFWTKNAVAGSLTRIQKVNVGGGALPAPSGEETLDASWTSGIAPGATIRIYASGSLTFVALDKALDRIITDVRAHPGVINQLSISLGLGEKYMPAGEMNTEHLKFLQLAALRVNVFVSTGDAGSNPDSTGHSPTGPLQAEYPASDFCVIAVGGTSLRLNKLGAVTSETGWTGSGGGASGFFRRPAWQKGPGVPRGTQRLVPDVSAAADPNTGAYLIFHGSVVEIGGTSWSAPIWAAFCALMNEERRRARKPPFPFLDPYLYPLIGSTAFRDITVGSNGAYHCGHGYDGVTGIGTPLVRELMARLMATP